MEEATFEALKAHFGLQGHDKTGFPIEWEDLKPILTLFNAYPVAPLREITSGEALEKAVGLQKKLKDLGLGRMKIYNCGLGRDMRNANLKDRNGVPFEQAQMPGTIIATPSQSDACGLP